MDSSNYRAAINFASLLMMMGDEERARRLLERALTVTESLPRTGQYGTGTNRAQILALLGRPDEAVADLRRAVDQGAFPIFSFNPDFGSLSDDPRYQAIRAEMDANLAEQLASALQMEAEGVFEPLAQ